MPSAAAVVAAPRIDVHLGPADVRRALARDVRFGLGNRPRTLPPKYFYDTAGSALFERITMLPEYYLTRAERTLLADRAEEIIRRVRPHDVVEIGPGASTKTRLLLDALPARGEGARYVPFDIDGATVATVAAALIREYPALEIHGVVGDFQRHLQRVPARDGRRLVLFLGSTIGNLHPAERQAFLSTARGLLGTEGRLLLGLDLVKERHVLEAAYDDAAGVTAAFNRNVLRVLNRGLRADFDLDAFHHRAWYNEADSRIEMHLMAVAAQTVRVRDLRLRLDFEPEETIWTESSYKFTRRRVRAELQAAGLTLEAWLSDPEGRFALALARSR